MGVMLQHDSLNQRLSLHNVVIKEEMSSSQVDLLTTGTLEENEHLFITTILQNIDVVNSKTEKQSRTDFLADLDKARKEHAQSVNQSYYGNSISNPTKDVNSKAVENSDKMHRRVTAEVDREYLEFAKNPEKNEDIRYHKRNDSKHIDKKSKLSNNDLNTIGMQWAYSDKTNIGDTNIIYDGRTGKYCFVEATKDDVGFVIRLTGTYNEVTKEKEYYDKCRGLSYRRLESSWTGQNYNDWRNEYFENSREYREDVDISFRGKHEKSYKTNGTTNTSTAEENSDRGAKHHNRTVDTAKKYGVTDAAVAKEFKEMFNTTLTAYEMKQIELPSCQLLT